MLRNRFFSVVFLMSVIFFISLLAGCSGSTQVTATLDLQNLPTAAVANQISVVSQSKASVKTSAADTRILWMTACGDGLPPFSSEMDVTGKTVVTQTFTLPTGPSRNFIFVIQNGYGVVLWRGGARQNLAGLPTTLSITQQSPAFGVYGIYPSWPNVPVDSNVAVVFTRAVDPSTISSATFQVTESGGTQATGSFTVNRNIAYFIPAGNFTAGKSYAVNITTGVKDTDGNVLPASAQASFQTSSSTSGTALRPTFLLPSNGSTAVPTSIRPAVVFNNRLAVSQSLNSLVTLTGPGGQVPGTVALGSGENSAIFIPTAPLSGATAYQFNISGDLAGKNGKTLGRSQSFSFTTQTDNLFTLTGTNPANGATNVSTSQTVTLTFSGSVNSATVGNGVTVSTSSGTLPSYTANVSGNAVVFTPGSAGWPSGAQMSFVPNSHLQSTTGTAFSGSGSLIFNTVAPSVFTLTGTSPANGATNVSTSEVAKLTFSEPVDSSTVSSGMTVSTSSGTLPSYTTTVSGNDVNFTPGSAGWPANAQLNFTPNSSLKSTTGTAFSGGGSLTFTTTSPFTLTGSTPANGATNVGDKKPVTLIFSQPVDSATVSSGVTVSTSSGTLPEFTWSVTDANIYWYPGGRWPSEAQLSFTPNSSLKSTTGTAFSGGGSLIFNTSSPFTWTTSSPANGATNVSTTQSVTLTFTSQVDSSTISSQVDLSTILPGITVSTSTGTLPSYTKSVSGNDVIFNPGSAGWPVGTELTFKPNENLYDVNCNSWMPPSGSTWTELKFTTQSSTAFSFVSSTPADGGTVPINNAVVFEFNQDVDTATISGAFSGQIYSSGQWWSNAPSCSRDTSNPKIVRCVNSYFSGQWECCYEYQIAMGSSLKSTGGQVLSNPTTINFTTTYH